MAGPNLGDSAWFDPENLADPWTDLPRFPRQRIGGNAVLLPEGPAGSTKVAAIGGRPYDTSPAGLQRADRRRLTSPSWSSFPDLHVPRSYPNTVLLPDRSMVTVGGDDKIEQIWPAAPEKAVELYDPVTGTWRTGPAQLEKRAYHSTALLLPDGRVLSTGDDLNPTSDGEISRGRRQTTPARSTRRRTSSRARARSSHPRRERQGNVPFGVGTSGEIDEAVLIAPSAVDARERHEPAFRPAPDGLDASRWHQRPEPAVRECRSARLVHAVPR